MYICHNKFPENSIKLPFFFSNKTSILWPFSNTEVSWERTFFSKSCKRALWPAVTLLPPYLSSLIWIHSNVFLILDAGQFCSSGCVYTSLPPPHHPFTPDPPPYPSPYVHEFIWTNAHTLASLCTLGTSLKPEFRVLWGLSYTSRGTSQGGPVLGCWAVCGQADEESLRCRGCPGILSVVLPCGRTAWRNLP